MGWRNKQHPVPLSVDLAATGELLAAPGAGLRYTVQRYTLVAAGSVTVKFESATTDLTGAMSLIAGVALVSTTALVCNENEALNLTLGGSVQVSGHLEYAIQANDV